MKTAKIDKEQGGQTATIRISGAYEIKDTLQERGYQFAASGRDKQFEQRFGVGSGDDANWYREGLGNDDIIREWAVLRDLGVTSDCTMLDRVEANWEACKAHVGLA